MSLFLYLVVGSVGMDLYVGCNNSSSFLLYSSISITTNYTKIKILFRREVESYIDINVIGCSVMRNTLVSH